MQALGLPRFWTNTPRNTNLKTLFRKLPVSLATFFNPQVTDKTDDGRANTYDRRTRGGQRRPLVFLTFPITPTRHTPMRIRQATQRRRPDHGARRLARGMDRLRQRCGSGQFDLVVGQTNHPHLHRARYLVWRCGDFGWRQSHARRLCTRRHHHHVRCQIGFRKILAAHVEFYQAMLRLQARRIRQLFGLVEDLNTLPLRARLAKQLLHLARSYGVPSLNHGDEVRIGLHLAQEELAQLLGASRQRVNQELKAMEREEALRIEPGGLVIRNREMLMKISAAE